MSDTPTPFETAPSPTTLREAALRVLFVQITTGLGLLVLFVGTVSDGRLPIIFLDVRLLIVVAFIMLIASWVFVRQSASRKIPAVIMLTVAFGILLLAYTPGVYVLEFLPGWILVPVIMTLGVSGWLVLRGRPGRSFLCLLILVIGVGIYFIGAFGPIFWVADFLLVVIAAWVGWLASRGAQSMAPGDRQAQFAADRERAQVEAQARAIKQWQDAYALVNPGQPIPPAPMAPVAGYGSYTGYAPGNSTNTLAVLSLVFGILGGYLAIILGHIALSQIKRTGEAGRGMALAGLILGYSWAGVTIIIIIVAIVATATRGPGYY